MLVITLFIAAIRQATHPKSARVTGTDFRLIVRIISPVTITAPK